MPRSSIWPGEDADGATPVPVAATGAGVAASPAAAEAYAGGQAALAAGDATNAALRLGVAVRLEPGFAQAVVDAVGPRPADRRSPSLAGDALRLLGRETEARAAFDVARGASPAPAADPAADRRPTPAPEPESEPGGGRGPGPASAEPVGERGDPTEG